MFHPPAADVVLCQPSQKDMSGRQTNLDPDPSPTLRTVIVLSLAMFATEAAVALTVGSVSLAADSIDFLEDASINLLVLFGLAWPARSRARLGKALSAVLLAPTAATALIAWHRLAAGTPPPPVALGLTGVAALAVNASCAWLLAHHRAAGGSLLRAAYLSARNDTFANLAIIVAGGMTALVHAVWPDLVVGLGIGALNAGAAWEVWQAARAEHRAA